MLRKLIFILVILTPVQFGCAEDDTIVNLDSAVSAIPGYWSSSMRDEFGVLRKITREPQVHSLSLRA